MTDTINEARALLAHWRGIGWSDDGSAPAYTTVAALVADLDRTRAELAAARAAMPTADERQGVQTCVVLTESRGERGVLSGYVREWLARLDAYHAAHPAASALAAAHASGVVSVPAAERWPTRPATDTEIATAYAMRAAEYRAAHPAASPAAEVAAAFGAAPDLPEPCAVCPECVGHGWEFQYNPELGRTDTRTDCRACNGTGRAGGGGHE